MVALFDDVPLVVRYDDDGSMLELVGRSAGPAGSLSTTLRVAGVAVDVDVDAADAAVVSVRVPVEGAALDRHVEGALAALVSDVSTVRSVIGTSTSRRIGRVDHRPNAGMVDVDLWQLVAAADDTTRPTRSDLQRALTSLEAVRKASRFGVVAPDVWDVSTALEVLTGSAGVDLVGLSDRAHGAVLALLGGLPVSGPDRRALDALLDLLDRSDRRHASSLPWAAGVEMGAPAGALSAHAAVRALPRLGHLPHLVPVAGHSLPAVEGGDDVAVARFVGESNIEVRVSGWGGRGMAWWARVRDDDDGTIVAAAPCSDTGADLVALLLVPPAGRWSVDVVEGVDVSWPSERLTAFAQAYGHGRAAARAERVGDPQAASRSWVRSARSHERSGDLSRAKLADARAGGMSRHRPPEPHVGDLV